MRASSVSFLRAPVGVRLVARAAGRADANGLRRRYDRVIAIDDRVGALPDWLMASVEAGLSRTLALGA